jgi:hypothetical protein
MTTNTTLEAQPPRNKSTSELQSELDDLSDLLYNGKFNESDLAYATMILEEMKRRGLELPGEKVGVGI